MYSTAPTDWATKICCWVDKISLQMEGNAFLLEKIIHAIIELKQFITDEEIKSSKN